MKALILIALAAAAYAQTTVKPPQLAVAVPAVPAGQVRLLAIVDGAPRAVEIGHGLELSATATGYRLDIVTPTHATPVTPRGSVKTDYGIYPAPAIPPSLPAAGSIILDPTFGTQVTRITDAADGLTCSVPYSYWPSFNKDSTWLMVDCTQTVGTWTEPVAMLYGWGPNGAIGRKIVKAISDTPGYLNLAGGIWSGVNPDILLVWKRDILWAYSVSKNTVELIKDFRQILPGEYQWQWHRSLNDDVFSFTRRRNSDYSVVGYAVWDRSTDTIVHNVNTASVDEVHLDKTGKYLVVKTGRSGAAAVESKYVNLETGAVREILDGAPDFGLGHSDNGSGIQVGEEDWNESSLWKYSLSDPSVRVNLLNGRSTWPWKTGGGHYSMLADDENWVLGSTIGGVGPLGSEFYLLATDGSARIRRFLHHHSIHRGYSDSPRPNISRDGKWVAFTSNWGGGRIDVYVAKIP